MEYTNGYRPTIFIASSGESKAVAEAIKLNFEHEADVDIWTENIFKLNDGTLETLMNRASYYDFFIAVFAADDTAEVKKEHKNVTRGNVIFEFGLFLGRIGLDRTFFVLEEGVDLFSDWNGITTTSFKRRDNLVAAIGASCIKIRERMAIAEKELLSYSVLPSTALAIGYYHNFLKPVIAAFQERDTIEIIKRGKGGKPDEKFEYSLTNHFPTMEVRVPQKLSSLQRDVLEVVTKDYVQIIIKSKTRSFAFYVHGEFDENSDLHIFDIPTTLFASYLTIKEVFTRQFLASENNERKLIDKEIRNFEKTLSKLIPDVIEHKFYTFSVY